MKLVTVIVAVLVAVPLCAGRDIYVAIDGNNANSGGPGDPYRTIKYAISQSNSGDVIHVRAGTYSESWIQLKSGTRLISEDGLHAARIYSGNSSAVRLVNISDAGVEGFEIYGNWNGGTSPGDGLVRVLDANNVWVKDCLIHDAGLDMDCIKIGADNVLIENCIVYNPSPRTSSGYQECIDIFGQPVPPDGVTVRGCWLYHTELRGGDYLIYAKGGSRNIVWENNVFGPAASGPSDNCSTSAGGPSPAVFPSCENFIARNNIFVGCSGDAAFGLLSAKNVRFYNNVIYDYRGGRAMIEFYTTGVGTNEDLYIYNNIFLQSNGKPIYNDRGKYSGTTYIPTNFEHDYNIYHQIGGGGDVDIYAEANSIFADPQLVGPAMPDRDNDTWDTIVEDFLLLASSPAINAGLDLSADVPYDILGNPRPLNGAFEIGVHELETNPVPPVIDPVIPDPATAQYAMLYSEQLTLSQGTAPITWSLPVAPAGAQVSSAGLVTWTPPLAQLGQMVAFEAQASNAQGADTESWQVYVGPTPPGYIEANGLVVIEAEHYYDRLAGLSDSWSLQVGDGSVGDGYMSAGPDDGDNINAPQIESSSPRLSYPVHFAQTGTYYLWVRGWGPDGAGDSIHYGLDGVSISADFDTAAVVERVGAFAWRSNTGDGGRPTIQIASAGLHSVDIWMREDGVRLDRLVLTTDGGYSPAGIGPDESSRALLIPGDLDRDGDVDLDDFAVLASAMNGPGLA
ncbi:MAG: DUF1565 domain-containing protein, partial [Phycisphaerae bacterium]